MKKYVCLAMSVVLMAGVLVGCSSANASAGFDKESKISVISREDGSGTRGAFVELVGIEKDDVDRTTVDANITNSTEVMMTSVAGDVNAIGYVSMGSLNDTVKAVAVDGVSASVDTVKDGSYKISRPFNIVTKEGDLSPEAADFMNYILSADGQKVIEDNGYISVSEGEYKSTNPSGKIVVAGSSSVTPVMEKLKEAYEALNKDVKVEVQESDSTTGVTSTVDGTCDIGMASRELKDEEISSGVSATKIAMDGICVIINKENTLTELTAEDIMNIFIGDATKWSDVIK